MLLYNCITVFSKLTLSHLLDPMAAQHLFAFESTRRHKSGLTDVKADIRTQTKSNGTVKVRRKRRGGMKKKELDLDCVT